jgi:hypothetical protein
MQQLEEELAQAAEFRTQYEALIQNTLAKDATTRQRPWTESITVSSRDFVDAMDQTKSKRPGENRLQDHADAPRLQKCSSTPTACSGPTPPRLQVFTHLGVFCSLQPEHQSQVRPLSGLTPEFLTGKRPINEEVLKEALADFP